METLIIKFDGTNKAVKQVLAGLVKMGAISVEKSPYIEKFVAKIASGDRNLVKGKGTKVSLDELWK